MSYENPIKITNNSNGEKIRKIRYENIHRKYEMYLKNLILRMIKDESNLRPTASEAYDELEVIEIFMCKPHNKVLKKCLDDLNNNNYNSEAKYKEVIKTYKKLNTNMNIIKKNNIMKEYGFSSSNSIYSPSIPNFQANQAIHTFSSIPQSIQYNNDNYSNNMPINNPNNIPYNYPNNNSFNTNNYAEQNNKNKFYNTQNIFYPKE